jgi:hypothetical protein
MPMRGLEWMTLTCLTLLFRLLSHAFCRGRHSTRLQLSARCYSRSRLTAHTNSLRVLGPCLHILEYVLSCCALLGLPSFPSSFLLVINTDLSHPELRCSIVQFDFTSNRFLPSAERAAPTTPLTLNASTQTSAPSTTRCTCSVRPTQLCAGKAKGDRLRPEHTSDAQPVPRPPFQRQCIPLIISCIALSSNPPSCAPSDLPWPTGATGIQLTSRDQNTDCAQFAYPCSTCSTLELAPDARPPRTAPSRGGRDVDEDKPLTMIRSLSSVATLGRSDTLEGDPWLRTGETGGEVDLIRFELCVLL